MLAATILHSLSAVCVLLIVIGFGVFLARKSWFDAPSHRGIVSKLVNAALPCFLFYSVISKFSHGELYNLLKFAGLPFLTVGLNFLISVLFIKLGWVRPHMKGTFIAAFTGASLWYRQCTARTEFLICSSTSLPIASSFGPSASLTFS